MVDSVVDFKMIPGYKALAALAEKMMLENWPTSWDHEIKGS